MLTSSTVHTKEETKVNITDHAINFYTDFEWYPELTVLMSPAQQIKLAQLIIEHYNKADKPQAQEEKVGAVA